MAGQKRGREDQERHGIRLPDGDGDDTSRFKFGEGNYKKKQKTNLSRKDKRKQERESKKKTKTQQKSIPKSKPQSQKTQSASKPKKSNSKKSVKFAEGTKEKDAADEDDFGGFSDDDLEDEEGDDALPFGEDDSLSEGDFEDFDEDDFDDEDEGDEDLEEGDDDGEEMNADDTMKALMALKAKKAAKSNGSNESDKKSKKSEEPQSVEDTMAALKAAKAAKANKSKQEPETAEDTMAALKAAKAAKANKTKEDSKPTKESKSKSDKKTSEKEKEEKYERFISPEDDAWIKRYDEDVKYYAKKLGLKGNKLKPAKDDDGIGSLLDGLDFLDEYDYDKETGGDYDDDEEEGDLEDDSEEEDDEDVPTNQGKDDDDDNDNEDGEQFDNPFSSDDEINSSDFDSDIDPEAEDEDEGDVLRPAPKENPYIAPVAPTSKYIPPALRQRLQAGDSEEITKIKKSIKGPLNKLSEANTLTIVNQINSVYSESPRQLVTECLTTVVLESIVQQATLLDQFVIQHAALAAAIYRLQGVEFGAHFTQTLVEKYEEHYKEGRSKEAGNMLTLLTACYSFQMISCKLLYNIIEILIQEITEMNSELLLRLVKNAGQQLRNDDPNALKDIIITLHANVSKQETNTRTKFLVETITNLKNNKSRFNNEVAQQLITRMKKVLATINNNKFHDPLHVSLDDIHNIKTKGKWWLVGSAWKGNLANGGDGINGNKDEELYDKDEMNEIIDSAEPNWMELARAQRMNTDIRRAIFISIMSSQDYIEAFTKLDKLRLKKSQEREIPKILLHCVTIEKISNPYYSLLAIKLCSSHSLRKTFQFCFWDFLKDLEGEDDESGDEDYFKNLNTDLVGQDDQFQLQRILNSGKFFGALIAEGSLPLHSLKNVNFLTINSDTSLFIEILMVTFFDKIGKKSEVSLFGQGSKKSKASDLKFQDNLIVGIIAKCETQKAMLRGLQYFLQEKVKSSDIVNGKKQQKRVDWGVDCVCDIADEYLK
ncbi:Suppressor of glycerol defect protein 1 [Wickerhamomyces ciferrii]|uniref:Suppressor of glycerol defect protein 1 n=1 Tax=Wickerhamomyces ciferrii (strain ATCC 14091 / BCRC 22168 / CBS 111 / JCM 3599 / NBRC 0793 / NRRL Y-1031 F-60-10) TaxID=1206466 RepID=K0KEL8_WICCF|nr:Suppressor of glycerol defect protein 1 [Wickerhamomyces ciferrii]CCH43580.1 Suppressor of glycerol defect protein 1 [Wickerhamomyces ciferrii]